MDTRATGLDAPSAALSDFFTLDHELYPIESRAQRLDLSTDQERPARSRDDLDGLTRSKMCRDSLHAIEATFFPERNSLKRILKTYRHKLCMIKFARREPPLIKKQM